MVSLHVEVHGASPRVPCRIHARYFCKKRPRDFAIWVKVNSPDDSNNHLDYLVMASTLEQSKDIRKIWLPQRLEQRKETRKSRIVQTSCADSYERKGRKLVRDGLIEGQDSTTESCLALFAGEGQYAYP